MAKFTFKGLEEYEMMLSRISSVRTVEKICGEVVFAGADIVADAVRTAINEIPVVNPGAHGTSSKKLQGITSAQKKGLQDSFGITPAANDDGYINVKLGFDGYNSVKTEKYPNGQPNSMIARSLNSGTSFRQKTRFIDKSARSAKAPAEKKMADTFDKKLTELLK